MLNDRMLRSALLRDLIATLSLGVVVLWARFATAVMSGAPLAVQGLSLALIALGVVGWMVGGSVLFRRAAARRKNP